MRGVSEEEEEEDDLVPFLERVKFVNDSGGVHLHEKI